MTASTKDLIEELRSARHEPLCGEAADALERLTQPVGMPEPDAMYGTDFYTAEIVARLIAERVETTKNLGRHILRHAACKKERDALQEQVQTLIVLLVSGRSSVKADLIAWEQLVARKEKAGSLNSCDSEEAQRIFDLLGKIDEAIAATEQKEGENHE